MLLIIRVSHVLKHNRKDEEKRGKTMKHPRWWTQDCHKLWLMVGTLHQGCPYSSMLRVLQRCQLPRNHRSQPLTWALDLRHWPLRKPWPSALARWPVATTSAPTTQRTRAIARQAPEKQAVLGVNLVLLMAEIPNNHLGCIRPWTNGIKLPINWCRISSISSWWWIWCVNCQSCDVAHG